MLYAVLLVSLACLYGASAANVPAVVKVPTQLIEKLKAVGNQCSKETGAPTEALINSISGNLPENETNLKYFFCLCKNLNILNDQGYFYEKSLKIFSNSDRKEAIDKAFNECKTLKAKDPYETAYKVANCFYKNSGVALSF